MQGFKLILAKQVALSAIFPHASIFYHSIGLTGEFASLFSLHNHKIIIDLYSIRPIVYIPPGIKNPTCY